MTILLCVILVLSLQFGHLQSEINSMSKLVHKQKTQEDKMQNKITSLTKEVKHDEWLITNVEKEAKKLEKKENALEKTEKKLQEAWGEGENDSGEIHQSPLKHHSGNS